MKIGKRISGLACSVLLVFSLFIVPSSAKTLESTSVETVFVYAINKEGKRVLLRAVPMSELNKLEHGQLTNGMTGEDTGLDYYYSYTDNFPATGYCEARGFTVPELLDYVQKTTSIADAQNVTYSGDDVLSIMATDGIGTYARRYTYNTLYGEKRYYFEGLYDQATGWVQEWEKSAGNSGTMEAYNANYADTDPYYADKRTTFATGAETAAILATVSSSGRTASGLTESQEVSLATAIEKNKNTVANSLAGNLDNQTALRICLPQSEATLMYGGRTADQNFKWIYNISFDMVTGADLPSAGTVAAPTATTRVSADGNTLYISLSCATEGASIYYSFDGGPPQILYTGTEITYDITGRDLAESPVKYYATAVKEGWDDLGVVQLQYYQDSPEFLLRQLDNVGSDATLQAGTSVSTDEWAAWTNAITKIMFKNTTQSEYRELSESEYTIHDRNIIFDQALFPVNGSYGLTIYADHYANRVTTLHLRNPAPGISAPETYTLGEDIVLTLSGESVFSGSIYLEAPGKTSKAVSSKWVDYTVPGQITLSADYYTDDACVITEPGTYTFRINNSNANPENIFFYIKIAEPSTAYDAKLSVYPGVYIGQAGDTLDLSVSLDTQKDIGAGSFSFVIDNNYFTPDTASIKSDWDVTVKEEAGKTALQVNTNGSQSGTLTVSGKLLTDGCRTIASVENTQFAAASSVYCGKAAVGYSIIANYADLQGRDDLDTIQFVADNNIMKGVGSNSFAPDAVVTKAMLAQMFYNMAHSPTVTITECTDVAADAWYTRAVSWALYYDVMEENGGLFEPNASISSAQLSAYLSAGAQVLGKEMTDAPITSKNAVTRADVAWAIANCLQW
ncbi:MAG: S-layer homology domain-containing protein [Oscillospiraceae bacterium]|nr:S-layer homology domain-containing protein [Oscillospiraceae bacterium]